VLTGKVLPGIETKVLVAALTGTCIEPILELNFLGLFRRDPIAV
jgi:hypothetical protein